MDILPKSSIFHNTLKNLTFQRRPKALVWSKRLNTNTYSIHPYGLISIKNMHKVDCFGMQVLINIDCIPLG